jgi:ABC-type sugar transport system permease subunit
MADQPQKGTLLKPKVVSNEVAHHHKQKENENSIVLNYLTIRKIVGWLGILLPIVLILVAYFLPGCHGVQASISDYHNTIARDFFVGLLCAISLFLFSYKGYEGIDNIIANITGILGFIVALCPTYIKTNYCSIYPAGIDWHHESAHGWPYAGWVTTVHLSCAATFLVLLGVYSYFLFTRTDKAEHERGKRKKLRNKVYRMCGIIIWVSMAILGVYVWRFSSEERDSQTHIIIIFECIALWAFGFSWLVKGETKGLIKFLQD